MWKKSDTEPNGTSSAPTPEAKPSPATPTRGRSTSAGTATIGQSITINGDVTGDEDLVIQGRIEGTVSLGTHAVTVGPEGRVKADVTGRVVMVEGQVEGNISGQEHICLRSSARVEGDLIAPRVSLEDGATFRGRIDMSKQPTSPRPTEPPKTSPAPSDPGSRNSGSGTEKGKADHSKPGSPAG
jgi:cytoskeletal protein CcmA (bactofilin family)